MTQLDTSLREASTEEREAEAVDRAIDLIRKYLPSSETVSALAEQLHAQDVPPWAVRRAVTHLMYVGELRLDAERRLLSR